MPEVSPSSGEKEYEAEEVGCVPETWGDGVVGSDCTRGTGGFGLRIPRTYDSDGGYVAFLSTGELADFQS